MNRLKSAFLKDIYLIILALILGIMAINIIAPFLTILLIALIIVSIFQPLYKKLAKRMRPGIAASICTVIVLLIVIVPIIILVLAITGEISHLTSKAPKFFSEWLFNSNGEVVIITQINNLLTKLNPTFQINPSDLQNTIFSLVSSIASLFSSAIFSAFQNVANVFIQFIVFIFALNFLFKDYEKIPKFISRFVPLSDELELFLYNEFISTGKSVIKGSFVVAFIHALSLTLIFSLFGIQSLSIFFLIIFVAGLIPGGPQIVWAPAFIILGLTSGWVLALVFGIACFLVMNMIDTFIRPRITQSNTKIHPLLSLLSVIGGLIVFGPVGLLYGPLIIVLFMSVMSFYNKRFKEGSVENEESNND